MLDLRSKNLLSQQQGQTSSDGKQLDTEGDSVAYKCAAWKHASNDIYAGIQRTQINIFVK